MREIKFRAWDKRYGEMKSPHDLYISGQGDEALNMNIHDRYIFMQYTGLKDRNGVEIYEGDVIKLYNRALFVIDFGEWQNNGQYETFQDGYGWYMRHISGWDDGNESLSSDMDGEVIGNLYENPELLEQQ